MAHDWRSDPWIEEASRACAVDVRRAIERYAPELFRTSVLQPALVAVSLAAWNRVRQSGVKVDVVAGHSVGEISAWAASGAITAEDAITIAAARGAAMEREANANPGGMIAVQGKDSVPHRAALRLVEEGTLELGARNASDLYVYTGSLGAIAEIEAVGGKRLSVSGPWHSKYMTGARAPLGRAIAKVKVAPTKTMLVTCLDGSALVTGSPDLVLQLIRPVLWHRVMSTIGTWKVTDVATFGPGKMMRAIVRACGFEGRIWPTDTQRDVDALAERVAQISR